MRLVVEGESDEDAARRLAEAAGHTVTQVYVKRGKSNLDASLPKYAKAAVFEPWVVFRDSDNVCPVELRSRLLASIPGGQPLFALRIAHTMTEAWLMADRAGCAAYFGISRNKLPNNPEDLAHAKNTLLQLCLTSGKRAIREGFVRGSGKPGPLFVHHINTFAAHHWDLAIASDHSPSLRRARDALRTIPDAPSS